MHRIKFTIKSFIKRPIFAVMLLFYSPLSAYSQSNFVEASNSFEKSISNPEYLLTHWISLPAASHFSKAVNRLSLRQAILLALRYNPNIQNAELDRIIQRYQLRLAYNEFELQYALEASGFAQYNHYQAAGNNFSKSFIATPAINLKTKYGTQLGLNIANNISPYAAYSPVLNFSVTQPLLRGFGKAVNQVGLSNAIDNEWLNKLTIKQAIMDQITQVIIAYRGVIISANNLKIQQRQLKEANGLFDINAKKIKAGQLEPTANLQQSYQIESLRLSVEQALNDFKTATQTLLQAIGLSSETKLMIPSNIELTKLHLPNLKDAVHQALQHNTQLLAQKLAWQAGKRAYLVAKNAQLWQLNLTTNVQSGLVNNVDQNLSQNIYNGQNTSESASLNLVVPIRDLNQRNQLIAAKVNLEKAKIAYKASKNALITTVTNTINAIQSQANQYKLAEKQVHLAEQAFNLEKKKQQMGISSGLDVNNTQNQFIQAQAGLMNAKIAYLNQIAALQQLLGTTLKTWQITLRFD